MRLALLFCLTARAWGAFGFYNLVTTTSSNTLLPASQSNFPALLHISSANMKVVGSGGKVQSSSGFDICFYTDITHTTLIPSKIEYYDGTNGILWTRVSPASLSQALTFYMFYGDSGVTTCGQDATAFSNDGNGQGFLPFSNGTSLSMTDLIGNLTATNTSASASTGQVDGGYHFSAGSGNNISIAANAAIRNVPGTWMQWFKSSQGAVNSLVMGETNNTSAGGPNVILSTGGIFIQIKDTGGTQRCTISSAASGLNDGNWHHVALEFRSSATTTLYVDGVSSGTCATGAWTFGSNAMRTGSSADSTWVQLVGDMDMLSIDSVSRSANWVTTRYQNELAPDTFFTFGGQVSTTGRVPHRSVPE